MRHLAATHSIIEYGRIKGRVFVHVSIKRRSVIGAVKLSDLDVCVIVEPIKGEK